MVHVLGIIPVSYRPALGNGTVVVTIRTEKTRMATQDDIQLTKCMLIP
jgi:hypothetical protein